MLHGSRGRLCFYSILVRLKAPGLSTSRAQIIKFLFHTGSIKSLILDSTTSQSIVHCFYSILVRLKVQSILSNAKTTNTFLFHTGSIKSIAGNAARLTRQTVFLFHTGSIKRAIDALSAAPDELGFYSILVRLKVVVAVHNTSGQRLFLFHTGSIKSR